MEKTGKSEVRVTRRAIDIMYPDTEQSKVDSLRAAAREPELFKALSERFVDGLPSETALQAFLIRQNFTRAAIVPASRAYLETFLFLENVIGSGSYLEERDAVSESLSNQSIEGNLPMNAIPQTLRRAENPVPFARPVGTSEGPDVRLWQGKIWLSGNIRTRKEADELIATIDALKPRIADLTAEQVAAPQEPGRQNDEGELLA